MLICPRKGAELFLPYARTLILISIGKEACNDGMKMATATQLYSRRTAEASSAEQENALQWMGSIPESSTITAAHCCSGQPPDIPTAAQVGHRHLSKGIAVKWKCEIQTDSSIILKYPIHCMTRWIYVRQWHRSCHTDQTITTGQRNLLQGSIKCQMEVPSKPQEKLSQGSRKNS